MNITKMSLVAALLIGSSAFAIDNVKTSGDAKLYYSTSDEGKKDLFNKAASAGQAAVSLSLSADLTEGVSAGTKLTTLTTLGLEGRLVNNVWEGTNGVTDSFIANEFWLAATVAKTTVKMGRMELDTPIAFSEKWSVVANSFEAAVVINQDIPNTTLVGAYVGGSNGQLLAPTAGTKVNGASIGIANVVQGTENESTFNQFYNGAFAVAVVNNSWKPLTAQAWYYDAHTNKPVSTLHGVQAYWLQTDVNMEGILLGAQYLGITFQIADKDIDSSAYAVMIGYEMKDTVTAKFAYSGIGKDHAAGMNLAGSGQSKLYTEAWWNYGQVTQTDTTSINLTVESPVNGIVDLGLYVTNVDHGDKNDAGNLMETTVTAGKTFGPLDATLAVIYADVDAEDKTGAKDPDAVTTVQAYLTYNF